MRPQPAAHKCGSGSGSRGQTNERWYMMDMEKLNRIEALIREERDLRETMAEMSEQKERIRQYCL